MSGCRFSLKPCNTPHEQGVLHRDIKPGNLLLDMRGIVWITDFGLAKANDQQDITHTGDILGTLRYMPPEAFEGITDARGDIYSLGLTLYEMLALQSAFDGKDRQRLIKLVTTADVPRLEKLNPEIPHDLATIVHKAIDREPRDRYATARDLAEDLGRFVNDEPIRARRQTAMEAGLRWARQHKAGAALMATIALVLVAVSAGSITLATHFRRQELVQQNLVNEKIVLATRNEKLADDNKSARETAEIALRQAEGILVDMHSARGQQACDDGHPALGTLWFAKAAEQATTDQHRRTTNQIPRARNWSRNVILPCRRFQSWRRKNQSNSIFNRQGELLLIRTQSRFMVWDRKRERPLSLADGTQSATAACWNPDGSQLAIASPGGEVQIRRVTDGMVLRSARHSADVKAMAYSVDGR